LVNKRFPHSFREAGLKDRFLLVVICLLFGIAFSVAGLFGGLLPVQGMLANWHKTQSWEPVSAQVLDTELKSSRSSKTTTYKVTARYRYEYWGKAYEGTRVGLADSGWDNIGSWHKDWHERLTQAKTRAKPVTIWVNPVRPEQAIIDRDIRWMQLVFHIPFATLFPAVGIGAFWMLWKTLRAPPDGPLPSLPRRNSRRILSDGSNAKRGMWLFAVFWNLLSFPIAGIALADAGRQGGLIWLVLIFPLVGLYLLYAAVRSSLAWRRFGELTLSLASPAPRLGEVIGGQIGFAKPADSDTNYLVSLVCEQVDTTGEDTRYRTVWQQQKPVRRVGESIVFAFHPPGNLPPSSEEDGSHHRWQIRVQTEDLALDRAFDIVIGRAETGDAAAITAVRPPSFDRRADGAAGSTGRVEIPPHIATVRRSGNGLEIAYPKGRDKGMVFTFAAVAAVFVLIAVCMPSSGMQALLFRVLLLAVGAGLAVAAIYCATHERRITVMRARLTVHDKWLLGDRTIAITIAELRRIEVSVGMTKVAGNRRTDFYRIVAVRPDGKGANITLGSGIPFATVVEAIAAEIRSVLDAGVLGAHAGSPFIAAADDAGPAPPWARRLRMAMIGVALLFAAAFLWDAGEPFFDTGTPVRSAANTLQTDVDDDLMTLFDRGDIEQLRKAFSNGADAGAFAENGSSLLMMASARRNMPLVRLLLEHGADVNALNRSPIPGKAGRNALMVALYEADVEIAKVLMDAGSRTDITDGHGWKIVHHAARRGCIACMQMLKERGFPLDEAAPGSRGETPMMVAAQFNHPELIRWLIDQGADPRARDRHGENVFGWARFFNQRAAMEVLKSYEGV
jgi:hypothetical protein